MNSSDSDVFFVEQISNEPSPQRNNSPIILNSTEISHTHTAGMPSVSSIASPEPQILTIHDDSNEPIMPNGFGRQLSIVPPSLNDLNLPPNPFNIMATMAEVNTTQDGSDDNYSPQSLEPSEPSPISTPPTNVSTFDSWETSHTTTDDNTFYCDDEPRRRYFCHQLLPCPCRPENFKRNWAWDCPFQKERECRNMSANPAVKRSPQQRTSQVHQTGTRTLKTFKLTYELSNLWFHPLKLYRIM